MIPDFKLSTVKLVLEEGRVAFRVARDLGISQKTVYGWIAHYKNDPKHPFVGSGKKQIQATLDEWVNSERSPQYI